MFAKCGQPAVGRCRSPGGRHCLGASRPDFFGGPRATFDTPESCGTFNVTSSLTPWSRIRIDPVDLVPDQLGLCERVLADVHGVRFLLTVNGGSHGILVTTKNLCKRKQVADVTETGQNGKTHAASPTVSDSCKK